MEDLDEPLDGSQGLFLFGKCVIGAQVYRDQEEPFALVSKPPRFLL